MMSGGVKCKRALGQAVDWLNVRSRPLIGWTYIGRPLISWIWIHRRPVIVWIYNVGLRLVESRWERFSTPARVDTAHLHDKWWRLIPFSTFIFLFVTTSLVMGVTRILNRGDHFCFWLLSLSRCKICALRMKEGEAPTDYASKLYDDRGSLSRPSWVVGVVRLQTHQHRPRVLHPSLDRPEQRDRG